MAETGGDGLPFIGSLMVSSAQHLLDRRARTLVARLSLTTSPPAPYCRAS